MSECEKAHIVLQKPRDLEQFNSSLQKLTRSKHASEEVLLDSIAKDVGEKYNFIKQQRGII